MKHHWKCSSLPQTAIQRHHQSIPRTRQLGSFLLSLPSSLVVVSGEKQESEREERMKEGTNILFSFTSWFDYLFSPLLCIAANLRQKEVLEEEQRELKYILAELEGKRASFHEQERGLQKEVQHWKQEYVRDTEKKKRWWVFNNIFSQENLQQLSRKYEEINRILGILSLFPFHLALTILTSQSSPLPHSVYVYQILNKFVIPAVKENVLKQIEQEEDIATEEEKLNKKIKVINLKRFKLIGKIKVKRTWHFSLFFLSLPSSEISRSIDQDLILILFFFVGYIGKTNKVIGTPR